MAAWTPTSPSTRQAAELGGTPQGCAQAAVAARRAPAHRQELVGIDVQEAKTGPSGEPILSFDLPFGHATEHMVVRRLAVHGGVEVLTVGAPGWFERRKP